MALWNPKAKSGQGLGYYVHYRAENYRKYGIQVNTTDGPSASVALAETHGKLKEIVNRNKVQGNLARLQDLLNALSQGNKEFLNADFGISSEQYDEIETKIKEKIEERFPYYKYNWENMDLQTNFDIESAYKYKGKQGEDRKYIKRKTMMNLVKSLEKSVREINKYVTGKKKNGLIDTPELRNLELQRKQIQKIRKEIYKLINEDKKHRSVMLKEENSERVWDLVNMANEMIASVSLPNSEEQGEAGELTLGVFMDVLTNGAENVTDETLSQIMIGKEKRRNYATNRQNGFFAVNYYVDLLNEKAGRKKSSNKRYKVINGMAVDVEGTYKTADLTLTFPEENKTFADLGLNGLTASLKNYENVQGYYGMSILDGVPLSTALSFVSTNFANHFLNLFSEGRSFYAQQLYEDELKRALVVRGLLGMRDILNPNSVDNQIMLIHNKGGIFGNYWMVFSASDLAMKYWDNVNDIIVNNLPGATIPNEWDGEKDSAKSMVSALKRITGMMIHIQQIKLKVSLKNIGTLV